MNVFLDDESFGAETDVTAQVLVPDSALKDIDLKSIAYQVIKFRDLEVDTNLAGRKAGNPRIGINLGASGIEVPKPTASRPETRGA